MSILTTGLGQTNLTLSDVQCAHWKGSARVDNGGETKESKRSRDRERPNLTAASTHGIYSVDPSIRPICTRCCFTMTHMIQVCGNFHCARVFITDTRPDEIAGQREGDIVRQSRPYPGLGFQQKVLNTFQVVPAPPGSGPDGRGCTINAFTSSGKGLK